MTRYDPDWLLNAVRSLPAGYRPTKSEWAMGMALAASTRGECTRRRVGAVVIDSRGRLAGAGYNGSEPGGPSCLDGGCPRGRHYRWTAAETPPGSDQWVEVCRCEAPWPCPEAVQGGGRHYKKDGRYCHVHGKMDCSCAVERCACFAEWPCPEAVSPGSSYDTGPGACEAVHAELNALLDVSDANRLVMASVYVTAEPCDGCLKILRTKPLKEIVFLDESGVAWAISHPFRRST